MESRSGIQAFSLQGKTAVVTGARSGIGQAIAIGLAQAGADLILWGGRGGLDETAKAVSDLGRLAGTTEADLTDQDSVDRAASEILAGHEVEILVNSAGMIRRGPAVDAPMEGWREVLTVNLDSLFHITQLMGAPMLERGHGKIIHIASMLSFQGGINVISYTASKHAVAGLTKGLANEWAGRGVQVNAIAPGYVKTANTQPLIEDAERYRAITARIPAGTWADPEDMVGAAVFLASGASDYVSGHILAVDGGWLAR